MRKKKQKIKQMRMLNEECLRIRGLIANPKKPQLHTSISFIVDTGATGIAIPAKVAEKLDLEVVGAGKAELADGRLVTCKIAYAYVYISGEGLITLVTFDNVEEPLLGVDIMGLLNLQIDAAHRKILKPIRRFKPEKMILFKAGKHSGLG